MRGLSVGIRASCTLRPASSSSRASSLSLSSRTRIRKSRPPANPEKPRTTRRVPVFNCCSPKYGDDERDRQHQPPRRCQFQEQSLGEPPDSAEPLRRRLHGGQPSSIVLIDVERF